MEAVRINSNGSIDGGFAVGTGFHNFIYAIAPAIDGSGIIYAEGACMSYDGTQTDAMAALIGKCSLD